MPVPIYPRLAGETGGTAICNDFEQHIAYQAYVELMSSIPWEPPQYEDPKILTQADHIRITDLSAIIRAEGDQPKLHTMSWSFPPANPKGPPVFNFKSEGRHFSTEQRCLIPASAFFEFTKPDDPKQKTKDRWRFERKDEKWMAIAGLWRPSPGGNRPPTFTMLTTDPGPDVAPIHNRQIVVVEPIDWKPWLYGTKSEKELLRPSAAETFKVARG